MTPFVRNTALSGSVLAFGIILAYLLGALPGSQSDVPAEAPVTQSKPKAEPVAKPAPEVQTTEAPAAQNQPAVPAFDVVRSESDGSMFVAGQAEPGAQLEVLVNGDVVSDTQVASDGQFATFVDLEAQNDPAVVTLRTTLGGRVALSLEDVIIAPPSLPQPPVREDAQPELQVVELPPEPQDQPLGQAADNETPVAQLVVAEPLQTPQGQPTSVPEIAQPKVAQPVEQPDTVQTADLTAPVEEQPAQEQPVASPEVAATSPAVSEPEVPEEISTPQVAALEAEDKQPAAASVPQVTEQVPAAPTILKTSSKGVEVLQAAPLAPGDVALDAISYDEAGEVLLAGRGDEDAHVRVYLDNAPLTTTPVDDDGRWQVELPQVDTGTYTLRVDQLDAQGDVIARVESPFLRESPQALQQAAQSAPEAEAAPIRSITVQPGHSLWKISRERYGDGTLYVALFKANRDKIRDPDLIYPGQIFDLPE